MSPKFWRRKNKKARLLFWKNNLAVNKVSPLLEIESKPETNLTRTVSSGRREEIEQIFLRRRAGN
jgi:hypothetical protein